MLRSVERMVSPTGLLLAALLLVALSLRLYNVNWDQSQHLHPDERYISTILSEIRLPGSVGEYFATEESTLNPYNHRPSYVYGTLPLFATKVVAEWLDRDEDGSTHRSGSAVIAAVKLLGGKPDNPDGNRAFDGGYNANLVGRVLSALADTATVLLTYFLGRAAISRLPGSLAATFVAFAPLHIQQSHFFTADSFLVFFGTACLLFLVLSVRTRRPWLLVLAGACLGLALASKVSGLLLAGPFTLTMLIGAVPIIRQWRRDRSLPGLARGSGPWVGYWALGLIAALAVFRIAQPYAFVNEGLLHTFQWNVHREDVSPGALLRGKVLYPNRWLALDQRFVDDLNNLQHIQEGSDFPPNVQWIGRTPFAWPIENIVRWGLGPFASLAALAGFAVVGWRVRARSLTAGVGILAAWSALVLLFYGNDFVTSMRYFLPIYPALSVIGGLGAATLISLAAEKSGPGFALRAVAGVTAAVALGGAIFFGLAFTSGVYGTEISRIAASRWMLSELPSGTVISHENWDDGLPIQAPGFPPNPFRTINLDLYGTDSREKMLTFAAQLDEIEVIVLSSNRLAESIPRHPARFPSMTRYYQALEDGSLGFEKVAEFTNEPRLLGISWSDARAEEAFTVYDHPTVRIFRKTAAYSTENTIRILQPDAADAAVHAEPGDAGTNSLMLSPRAYEAQQAGGTWREVFSPDGLFAHWSWVWWFLWLQVAFFAVLPWWTWVFRAVPDRGYGLAKLAGPCLIALVAWSAVAWGLADFSRSVAWVALLGGLAIGAVVGVVRWRPLLDDWRQLRGTWLTTELVFGGVFAFFLVLRASNPDLWFHPTGGEKPMEVAYLTAVVRSTEMPPYDPWLAGGYLNYYYFGWFVLAVPIRAFQLVPEVAFNLAVPSFAAMAAAASFSCVAGLLGGQGASSGRRRIPGWSGGLLAVFLAIFAGNLDAAHQTIERLQRISSWQPETGFAPFDGLASLLGGVYAWLVSRTPLAAYDWWRSSRVHFGSSDITEFPYWSFLFADLHPHLMGIPIFICLAGVAAGYIHSCRAGLQRQAWAIAAGSGVLIAVIRMAHTWDLPIAAVLVVTAVGLGQMLCDGPVMIRLRRAAIHLLTVGAIAQIVAMPYLQHAEVFNQGIVRSPSTTPPEQFFAHFGVFLVLAAFYLVVRHIELGRTGSSNGIARFVGQPERLLAAATLLLIVVLIAGERGYAVVAAGTAAAVLLANLVWVELREDRQVGRIIATVFMLLGLVVAVSVDLVVVKDDIGRMNTVFKFSLQAWHLLALGSAFATVYTLAFIGHEISSSRGRWLAGWWRLASRAIAAMLVLALLFPIMGTGPRQAARFEDLPMTLDGLAYLSTDPTFQETVGEPGAHDDPILHLAEDEPLFRWLRENVDGSPTIVEAVGPLYHWTGRYSINTGLPAVIGWDWHQIQQRGTLAGPVGKRREETQQFYADGDREEAERFLRRYDVSYVIVGPWERAFGSPGGIEKLATMAALQEVFRSGENVIYAVDKAALQLAVP